MWLVATAGVLAAVGPAAAQAPGFERRTAPGGGAPELRLPPPPPPSPGFVLPPVPELPPTRPGPSEGVSVLVREIRLEGNTVVSTAELEPIVRRYEGRALTIEELLRLRDELTLAYVERGYVNSGALLPDQDVSQGIVTFRIVEGRLDEIRLEGLRSLDPAFLEARIRRGAGPPLNVRDLQEQLQLLLLDPTIERLGARLGPGARPGASVLEADIVEGRRLRVDARLANDWSPSVGAEHGEIGATFFNLLGRGDPLRLEASASEGSRQGYLAYSVPVTASDLRLYGSGEITRSDVVEHPFNQLDIQSRTWSLEFGASYPVLQRVADEVRLGLALSRRHSETSLLNEPFSFSPGAKNGKSDITALRFRQDWDHRGRDLAVAFRSTFSLGLDAFGATINKDAPDSRYLAWLGQFELARRLFEGDHQLVLRGSLQLASDPLLPLEQFAIGGLDTVRGYREDLLVLDNGYTASIEYRLPLFRLPIPGWSESPEDGILYLAPFADIGGGFNTDSPTPDPDHIYSIGSGLRWSPAPGFNLALYAGVALKEVPNPQDRNLQDQGIHFEVQLRLY
ncbi:ShlB/FhaC/HecB family hemolysin secretion/activation protein [Benzoatithermus flavus]|uniref:POTRA domain-containing protein n=1 Tax=Benzoatithermus flavus TaxID=3108223 RepID=A0ABU8XSK3_9PROT